MRKGLAYLGAALLVVGVVVFFAGLGGASQVATDLVNCGTLSGFQVPSACANALGALWMYEAIEGTGGIFGIVGLILFIVGLTMEPERPVPVAAPYYVPPTYPPPPSYAPPPNPPSPPTPP